MGQNAYILLHGLFFLEYKGPVLFVTAPTVMDHDYRIGNPEDGANLKATPPLPNNIVHWENTTLKGGSAVGFPEELFCFSKKEANTGDITDDQSKFTFRLVLPRPIEIIALRQGDRSDFPAKPGNIWTSIVNHSKSLRSLDLGLVMCLRYQGTFDPLFSTTNRCHIYAECDCPADLNHTNDAYASAAKMFSGNFDLQVDPNPITFPPSISPLSPAIENLNLSELQNRDQDEFALTEFFRQAAGINCPLTLSVNVANCGQFGVLP